MIALLTTVLPRVVSPAEVEAARARVGSISSAHDGHGAPVETKASWHDAAAYTISDLTMIRRELVIGFVVAGFAAIEVPTSVWRAVFVTGHGFWSSLENVLVGPFVAVISFVCSVGNVPLAATLWQGGISFGGAVSFVFADLIAFPLLVIYRKYYGTRLTLKLLAVFWATMSAAGLVTEYAFRAAGLLPSRASTGIDLTHLGWNYTTVLDVVAAVGFAWVYRLYRTRPSSERYAQDPVCGMQVEVAHAPASLAHQGDTVYFCSDHCAHRFSPVKAEAETGHR